MSLRRCPCERGDPIGRAGAPPRLCPRYTQNIPGNWQAHAYPSLKALNRWVDELVERLDFLTNWIEHGIPPTFWVPGFYFPQARRHRAWHPPAKATPLYTKRTGGRRGAALNRSDGWMLAVLVPVFDFFIRRRRSAAPKRRRFAPNGRAFDEASLGAVLMGGCWGG